MVTIQRDPWLYMEEASIEVMGLFAPHSTMHTRFHFLGKGYTHLHLQEVMHKPI